MMISTERNEIDSPFFHTERDLDMKQDERSEKGSFRKSEVSGRNVYRSVEVAERIIFGDPNKGRVGIG